MRLAAEGVALTVNDRALLALRDRHRGQRAFIVGNGPSLRMDDLDRLVGEVTFGCNRIYLAFPETRFRPTYYTAIDALGVQLDAPAIDAVGVDDPDMCKLMPYDVRPWLRRRAQCVFFDMGAGNLAGFSGDPLRQELFGGYSVLFIQMQLAFYMGVAEVYVIGCDHHWRIPAGEPERVWGDAVLTSEGERNHFHPDYRRPGERWNLPKVDLQEKAFAIARRHYERAGRRIFNATRGGQLEVFERRDFDEVVTRPS